MIFFKRNALGVYRSYQHNLKRKSLIVKMSIIAQCHDRLKSEGYDVSKGYGYIYVFTPSHSSKDPSDPVPSYYVISLNRRDPIKLSLRHNCNSGNAKRQHFDVVHGDDLNFEGVSKLLAEDTSIKTGVVYFNSSEKNRKAPGFTPRS